jgi:D-amino-acid oxidase
MTQTPDPIDRRDFLRLGGATVAGLALSGCSVGRGARAVAGAVTPARPRIVLPPVDVSWDRIIRTTVGLRPYRPAGFVVRTERMDDKTLIHNYGHGGSGWSLSWGTGQLATELALQQAERRVAVIGCGAVGLTAARQLQRHGFEVTVYAKALPPDTTSNMSWAAFTPVSGLVANGSRTPAWDDQFRRAVEIAYRHHQLLVGQHYGVSWIDEYVAMSAPRPAPPATLPTAPLPSDRPAPLLPSSVQLGRVTFGPGEHPFPSAYVTRVPNLRFEPSIYLDALMRDVLTFGGRIVVRAFESRRDLATLPEPVIVNCTGLGSRDLFGDMELIPIKGQLTVLVPQPEVNYSAAGMLPRSDGIVLGHVMQRGVWSLDVDLEEQRAVAERARTFFAGMKSVAMMPRTSDFVIPPVESFFDRVS